MQRPNEVGAVGLFGIVGVVGYPVEAGVVEGDELTVRKADPDVVVIQTLQVIVADLDLLD